MPKGSDHAWRCGIAPTEIARAPEWDGLISRPAIPAGLPRTFSWLPAMGSGTPSRRDPWPAESPPHAKTQRPRSTQLGMTPVTLRHRRSSRASSKDYHMKLAAMIARSLQADMQAELRDIERAVTTGTRDAGRGLKAELRRQVDERRARAAARQQLAGQALPEPEARRREPGLHQGAADHPRVRRGRGDPEQAWALSRDPDRERAEEGHRWQADQPEHLPGAPLRTAAVRASAERTVAPGC